MPPNGIKGLLMDESKFSYGCGHLPAFFRIPIRTIHANRNEPLFIVHITRHPFFVLNPKSCLSLSQNMEKETERNMRSFDMDMQKTDLTQK